MSKRVLLSTLAVLSVFAAAAIPQGVTSRSQPNFDLVILHGRVMDPESGLDAVRNIGMRDGIIRSVSRVPLKGRLVLDATGLIVSPGFIDLDSYSKHAQFQVRDGVTTVFDIREGTADVNRWYSEREQKMLINFGVGIGYMPVRTAVMGSAGGLRREHPLVSERERTKPTEAELFEILRRLQRGFDEGAVGLGMGSSGTLDPTGWEIVEAFRVAAKARAHVVATLRDDIWVSSNISANLSQMIGAAAVTGAPLHIPHLTSSAGPHVPRLLEMIKRARERGLDVTAEEYPYRAAVGRVRPTEADEWSESDWQDVQLLETGERLTRNSVRRLPTGGALVIFHNSPIEPYVVQVLTNPFISIASHSYLNDQLRGHPRTAGTYSRLLGRYVREQKLLSLMEALRKITLMPAKRLEGRVPGMRRKGRIRVGADADLTIFDQNRISDRATYTQPTLPSDGIRYVIVNGIIVVKDGKLQEGVAPGRAIRAPISSSAGVMR